MTCVRQGGHDVSLGRGGVTWHRYCRLPIDYRPASTGYQVLQKQPIRRSPLTLRLLMGRASLVSVARDLVYTCRNGWTILWIIIPCVIIDRKNRRITLND